MTQIPQRPFYSSRRGDRGLVVFAIQRGLNARGAGIVEDADYGPQTERAVKDFQLTEGLGADGVFGPQSSLALAIRLERGVEQQLPRGLLRGIMDTESQGHIGAVSWDSPGGVDCSYLQRRVYENQFDTAAERRAFDGPYQFELLGRTLRERFNRFHARTENKVRAWRLAALGHNYPYAADRLSYGPWKTRYSTSPQGWVEAVSAVFEDSAPVRTPLDWCMYMALGSKAHDHTGRYVRFVKRYTD